MENVLIINNFKLIVQTQELSEAERAGTTLNQKRTVLCLVSRQLLRIILDSDQNSSHGLVHLTRNLLVEL